MPDVIVTRPQSRVKYRLCAGTLSNGYFEPKGGHFEGSTIDLDAQGNPVPGTEKRDTSLDFDMRLTEWKDGVQTPTALGMRMVTFNDPLTGKVITVSLVGLMAGIGEAVSAELARRLGVPA